VFPEELMQYKQWVCWKYEQRDTAKKPTKVPYNPLTGNLAHTDNPATWADYTTAVRAALHSTYYNGIGFVLSEDDPYTIIDLDDPENNQEIIQRHRKIMESFHSYAETSPSGNGVHIIIKADIPSGRRRGKVEMYSSERYFTMTGNTLLNYPIAEQQDLAGILWAELGGEDVKSAPIIDAPIIYTDEQIYNMAREAQNGEKFLDLWNEEWGKYYGSGSEGAFGLIDIIGFYSRNSEQIKRLFYYSKMGQRDKWVKRPKLVDNMIKRSFDNQLPAIPIEQIKLSLATQLAKQDAFNDKKIAVTKKELSQIQMPPGLMGELAQFILAAAPRPVKEIAIGAAIGLMAGICGRAYNISGTGLNQYVLILAKTGTGKEAAASGIDRLMQEVKKLVPSAMEFLGPAEIASGQALVKYLAKYPSFVSIVGEFGLYLQEMCSPSANASQIHLRKTMLALYNKSGASDSLRPIIYSDKEKNTEVVRSPAFSLLGESTPESFYMSLDQSMIEQGLLPRFMCIEYTGNRPALNHKAKTAMPSNELVQKVCEISVNALTVGTKNHYIEVILSDEAQQFSSDFNIKCDNKINSSELEVERQLWNRGHIKILKLSALVAIGKNPYTPVVDLESIKWAADIVERDILNVLVQFETGKAGRDTSEVNQVNEVVHIVREYISRPASSLEKYQVLPEMHRDKVFSMSYLQRRLLMKAPFQKDRIGASNALERVMKALQNDGSVRELRQKDVYDTYGRTMKAYIITDIFRFAPQ
jgi:hypothetical protein